MVSEPTIFNNGNTTINLGVILQRISQDLQEIDSKLSNLNRIFPDCFDCIKKLLGVETEAESEILVTDFQCSEGEWSTAAMFDHSVGKKRHSKDGLKSIATMSDWVLKVALIDTNMPIKELSGEDAEKLGQSQKKD